MTETATQVSRPTRRPGFVLGQLRIPFGSEINAGVALHPVRNTWSLRPVSEHTGYFLDLDAYLALDTPNDPGLYEQAVGVWRVTVDRISGVGLGPTHSDSGDDCLVIQGFFRID